MEAFTVHLLSNECDDSFDGNTNYKFSNPFPFKCYDMTAYEVALTHLSYYDMYKPVKTEDPFSPALTNNNEFYDLAKGENKLTAERWPRNEIRIQKKRSSFGSFVTELNGICKQAGIDVIFTQRLSRGEFQNIIIKFSFAENTRLIISPVLANILGFNTSSFASGEHVSPAAPNVALYGTFAMHSKLGSITKEVHLLHNIDLDQCKGFPTATTILSEIVLKLSRVNFNITMRVRKEQRLYEWNCSDMRVTLSPFLNKYLLLDDDFRFEGKGKIFVPKLVQPSPNLCVTTNIIRNQVYLGRQEKVLAVVERQETDFLKRTTYVPQFLLYNDIVCRHVTQIQLGLLTDKNSYLDFSKFPTSATLHFRKKFLE